MVNDKKAEELEAKGLYRRAASRWLEVFDLCDTEADREWLRNRRNQ
ncbi:PerC family transcriptional regulator [Pseudomonas cerasi]